MTDKNRAEVKRIISRMFLNPNKAGGSTDEIFNKEDCYDALEALLDEAAERDVMGYHETFDTVQLLMENKALAAEVRKLKQDCTGLALHRSKYTLSACSGCSELVVVEPEQTRPLCVNCAETDN